MDKHLIYEEAIMAGENENILSNSESQPWMNYPQELNGVNGDLGGETNEWSDRYNFKP